MAAAALLPPYLARRAEEARLGRYLGALTPPRAQSLRTVLTGLALGALVAVGWTTIRGDSGWLTALHVIGGIVAVGFAVVGVIELMPGPGEMLLFEEGFVHVLPDGDVDALAYAVAPGGEELRARARHLMTDNS